MSARGSQPKRPIRPKPDVDQVVLPDFRNRVRKVVDSVHFRVGGVIAVAVHPREGMGLPAIVIAERDNLCPIHNVREVLLAAYREGGKLKGHLNQLRRYPKA